MAATLKRKMFSADDPRGPTKGEDVKILKFGLHRYEDNFFKGPPWDEVYNDSTGQAVSTLQRLEGIAPASGNVGQATWNIIWNYLDAYRKYRYRLFRVPVPPPPPLIEPIQGFDSLAHSLWEDYSLGRRMGMTDLGTYNNASRLPSGAKSDHAYYPSYAFDLGFSPQIGMRNEIAKAFFNSMVGKPEVSYVICGDVIWSQGKGLHAYPYGNHDNHVHVSARH